MCSWQNMRTKQRSVFNPGEGGGGILYSQPACPGVRKGRKKGSSFLNLVPRVFSLSNMAAAGEKTSSLLPPPYWKARRLWGRGCSFPFAFKRLTSTQTTDSWPNCSRYKCGRGGVAEALLHGSTKETDDTPTQFGNVLFICFYIIYIKMRVIFVL